MITGDGAPAGRPAELTSFVGRQNEIRELRHLLTRSRLVTLTGVGGVGKTRLAVRVSAATHPAYRDGTAFVDLTQVSGPDQLHRCVLAQLQHSRRGDPDRPPARAAGAVGRRQRRAPGRGGRGPGRRPAAGVP